MLRLIVGLLVTTACMLPAIILAQDTPLPTRDPIDLAARYLNYAPPTGEAAVPPLPEPYIPFMQQPFWVTKRGDALPTQITAVLAATIRLPYFPDVMIWVEDGVRYNAEALYTAAQRLANGIANLSARSVIDGNPLDMSGFVSAANGNIPMERTDLLTVPDVDNDGFIHLLFASDLDDDRVAFTNPNDRLPANAAPGGFSNVKELIYINRSALPNVPLHNGAFLTAAARAYVEMLLEVNYPDQALWLRDAYLFVLENLLSGTDSAPPLVTEYLSSPNTALLGSPATVNGAIIGGRYLFDSYLRQRFGDELIDQLYVQPGNDLSPITALLEAHDVIDPVSGGVVTGEDAFADFALANVINIAFGDGRYVHNDFPLQQEFIAQTREMSLTRNIKGNAAPLGGNYFHYIAPQDQLVTLSFEGVGTVPLLSFPASDEEGGVPPDNTFYWSGASANADSTMTRLIDLRDVDQAALTFDTWYDLASNWNYGYVSVSVDGGESWEALPIDGLAFQNAHGAAYGPGFTGHSSGEESESAPMWQRYSVDLSPYAGREVLLRFEYISMPGMRDSGFAVDNLSIEAIGFEDDGDESEGWTMNGWSAMPNHVPAEWLVQVVSTGTDTEPPRAQRLIMTDENSGEWQFGLSANEGLIVAVSLMNQNTLQPAAFQVELNEAAS